MSDDVIGRLAVAFRPCCSPGPLQLLLRLRGRLRESKPGPEDQPAHRRGQPVHASSPVMKGLHLARLARRADERDRTPARRNRARITGHATRGDASSSRHEQRLRDAHGAAATRRHHDDMAGGHSRRSRSAIVSSPRCPGWTHEAARAHHAHRRCGCGAAARGARQQPAMPVVGFMSARSADENAGGLP